MLGPVEVGPIAHGGHCVARHDGRVIFVRHALTGERVMIKITDTSHDRYWRGDAVEVITPADERVEPGCPISGPGGCGGCDFQHVAVDHQRELKRRVVAEQLDRLAGVTWEGSVEAVSESAVDWRTRVRLVRATETAPWGLRRHHSHRIIALPEQGCAIAHPDLPAPPVVGVTADLVVSSTGQRTAIDDAGVMTGPEVLTERVGDLSYEVAAAGFWQVHPRAAETLVSAVLEALAPRAGETALDLYCGVGLFAGALAAAGAEVWGVESDRRAIARARDNVPAARFRAGRVEDVVATAPDTVDLVVLDPPRQGAGRAVMTEILRRRPRAIAYVACDPAALARDVAIALEAGWRLDRVRAFDLFPMTHHVECVAVLVPGD